MKVLAVIFSLFLTFPLFAEIHMEVSVITGVGKVILEAGKKVSQTARTTVLIYVKNSGDKIERVPTRNFELLRKMEGQTGIVTLDWTYSGAEAPRLIVVPEQDFGIVELRKGETAAIYIQWPSDWPDPEKMEFELTASSRIRERYQLSLPEIRARFDPVR